MRISSKRVKERDVVENAARELELHPVAEINEYYIDVSNRFKIAKYAALIFLVVFVMFMISVFRNDITLENCKYFIRSITSGVSVYKGGYDEIFYDTSGVMDIAVFNGDLVTVKNDGVDFYDMNGNNTESYDVKYVSPIAIHRGKYMLIYDLGGNTFDLYNNFSKLSGESFDYPISAAAISEEGMHAVVTESLESQSVINLYDHSFDLVSYYRLDKQYISDIKIDPKGEKVLFCAYKVTPEGNFEGEIVTYAPYSNEIGSSYPIADAYPVACGFHSGGGYSVLTDSALLFFDSGNNLISEFKLGNIVPNDCLILEDNVVLSYNKSVVGSQNELLVFSSSGDMVYTSYTEDKILDTATRDKTIYFLLDSKVLSLDLATGERKQAGIESGVSRIYIGDKDNLVLGFSNKAKSCEINKLFEESEEKK